MALTAISLKLKTFQVDEFFKGIALDFFYSFLFAIQMILFRSEKLLLHIEEKNSLRTKMLDNVN